MRTMDNRMKQQWGGALVPMLLFILAGAAVLIIIKVFPVIYDGKSVQKMFVELPNDEKVKAKPGNKSIQKYIERSLQVNQIKYIDMKLLEIKKDPKNKLYRVTLNYDVPVELRKAPEDEVANVIDAAITITFRNQVEVPYSVQ